MIVSCWEKNRSDFWGDLHLVRCWVCRAKERVWHLFQSLVTIKCHFILDFGVCASFQLVRTEKTQIKSRPISTANWDSGSLPVDSFSAAHLAFDVLQVWSSLFKEAGPWVLVGLGFSGLSGTSSHFHHTHQLLTCRTFGPESAAATSSFLWEHRGPVRPPTSSLVQLYHCWNNSEHLTTGYFRALVKVIPGSVWWRSRK